MALTITNIAPDFGPVAGGTAITITGTDFDPAATVALGGVALESIVVADATSITGVTPAGTLGIQTLQVENPGPAFSDPVNFCYTGTEAGWRLVRMFPGADTVLLSADGLSVLVPQIDELANELILHRSDDAGATFTTTTIAAPEGVTLTATSYQHFADATLTVLLFPNVTESLLSTDSGATFSVVDHNALGSTCATGSADGQVLMLIMNGEGAPYSLVQLSINGGDTWTVLDPDADNHRFLYLTNGAVSDDGQKIIVLGSDGEGANQAASTDGGATWAYRDGLPVDFFLCSRVAMTRDGATIFASGYDVIYRSDDFGANWIKLDQEGLLAISNDAQSQAFIRGAD